MDLLGVSMQWIGKKAVKRDWSVQGMIPKFVFGHLGMSGDTRGRIKRVYFRVWD